jgi:hypothetical protein
MRPRHVSSWIALLILLGGPAAVPAGMPTPLPTQDVFERVARVNDTALARLQTISFFLVVLLACAGTVQGLWNYLRRDFPRLPRLSFGRALAGVLLWGLLFVIVLAMISGARELMTPGAWQKQGFTYKLTPGVPGPEEDPAALRKQHLERLRVALWHFAATHNGRFPSAGEMAEVPADLWTIPDSGGMRYQYFPGLNATQPAALLACEPELDPRQRFVLRSNGDVAAMSSAEVQSLRNGERRP